MPVAMLPVLAWLRRERHGKSWSCYGGTHGDVGTQAVAKEMRGKVRLGKKKMFLSAAEKAVKAKAAARLQSKAAAAVKKWG